MRSVEEIRERLEAWAAARATFSPLAKVHDTLSWVPSELRWILGEDESGALHKVVWICLVGELHDAECTMRREGLDLVLEGRGDPADSDHPGRTFRFWLRLVNGQFKDERASRAPIEKIWILYPWPSDCGFALTAQDDTLSGIIEFSGDDFEYRMWDYSAGSAKG